MKISNWLIVTIFILLLLNVGQLAVYNWQNYFPKKGEVQPSQQWKTIVSEKGKFSFQYPPDWPISFIPDSRLADYNNFNNLTPNNKTELEEIHFNEEWEGADSKLYGIMMVWKQPGIETLDDYVKSIDKELELFSKGRMKKIPRPKIKYSVIGGQVAATEIAQGEFSNTGSINEPNRYVIVHNGLIYLFFPSGSDRFRENTEENLAKFNKILSSIKFLD